MFNAVPLQVIEFTVAPAILTLARSKSLLESKILDVIAIEKQEGSLAEYIERRRMDWRRLILLPKLKEWAIFGLLACPGQVTSAFAPDLPSLPRGLLGAVE